MNDLYEQARRLEEAAENGDTEYIEKNHDRLLKDARDVADFIRASEVKMD